MSDGGGVTTAAVIITSWPAPFAPAPVPTIARLELVGHMGATAGAAGRVFNHPATGRQSPRPHLSYLNLSYRGLSHRFMCCCCCCLVVFGVVMRVDTLSLALAVVDASRCVYPLRPPRTSIRCLVHHHHLLIHFIHPCPHDFQELHGGGDVAEAVRRFTELRCTPISLRVKAVEEVLRMACE